MNIIGGQLMKLKNCLRKFKDNKKGFTLIEMIVVIAIIGVLAAILVPSLSGYLSEAKDTQSEANARTFYTAAQAAVTSLEIGEGTYVKSATKTSEGATATPAPTGSKDLDTKIESLLGTANYAKFTAYTIKVDENSAVTEVNVTVNGKATTYPES